MNLPNYVDKTPNGKIVKVPNIGTENYIENVCYSLQISFMNNVVFIEYHGEDGSFLEDEEIEFIIKNREELAT